MNNIEDYGTFYIFHYSNINNNSIIETVVTQVILKVTIYHHLYTETQLPP